MIQKIFKVIILHFITFHSLLESKGNLDGDRKNVDRTHSLSNP